LKQREKTREERKKKRTTHENNNVTNVCVKFRKPNTRCPKPIYKAKVNPMTNTMVTSNMEHKLFPDMRKVVNNNDILFDTRKCLNTTSTDKTMFTDKTHSANSKGYAIST